MRVYFVNKIQNIYACLKLDIKNSIIVRKILIKRSFIFIEFELIFVFYQLNVSFDFVKQIFIANINYYNFVENYRI